MKWLLVVSALLGTDADPMLFATETVCMAAAAAVAEDNPNWEWVDRPGAADELRQLVARPIIECVGADDGPADTNFIPAPTSEMKWLLVIFVLAEHQYERIAFATEVECVAAAEAVASANPGFESIDDPSGSMGWAVIRSTVECCRGWREPNAD